MKTNLPYALALISVLCSFQLFSQDIIILKTGDEIQAKVEEIKPDVVTYRKFENIQGPLYIVEKTKIFMIKYANGSKDVFAENGALQAPQTQQQTTTPAPQVPQAVTPLAPKELPVNLEYWNGGKVRLKNSTQTPTQVKNIMRPYPEAFSLYTSGRSLKITGDVFEGIGYAYIAAMFIYSINGNQTMGKTAAGFAIASLGTSFVLEAIGKSNIKKSVKTYNSSIVPTSHLYISPLNLEYCLRF